MVTWNSSPLEAQKIWESAPACISKKGMALLGRQPSAGMSILQGMSPVTPTMPTHHADPVPVRPSAYPCYMSEIYWGYYILKAPPLMISTQRSCIHFKPSPATRSLPSKGRAYLRWRVTGCVLLPPYKLFRKQFHPPWNWSKYFRPLSKHFKTHLDITLSASICWTVKFYV